MFLLPIIHYPHHQMKHILGVCVRSVRSVRSVMVSECEGECECEECEE